MIDKKVVFLFLSLFLFLLLILSKSLLVNSQTSQCFCSKDNFCDNVCYFNKYQDIKYADRIKCSLSQSLFVTSPTQDNKNSWCQRPKRTMGDADGNGLVNKIDYYYYVAAVNGGKIPVLVNADFNGDGEIGLADRAIVILSLMGTPTPTINLTQTPTSSPTVTPPTSSKFLTKSGELWWLVDENGNKFFSLGVSGPKYPSKTQSLKLFEYLKAHGIDEEQYLSDMFGNLKKWGFNSLAGLAPHEFNLALWEKGGEPLHDFISIHTIVNEWEGDINFTLKDVNNNPYPSKHTFPDPFNPQWKQKAEERIQEITTKFRDAPFVMGYFINNELGFSKFNRFIWSSYCVPEFIKFLKEKYGNNINRLNQEWSVNYASFEEIGDDKYNLDKSTNSIIRQDIEKFTFKIVEAYIDTTISLVRKYDEKHLIMSNRFMRWKFEDTERYLPLFSKFDVIALNRYPGEGVGSKYTDEELENIRKVYEITGRPILISEWSVTAREGFTMGNVSDQKEREEAYQTCLKQLLELPFVVGAHWFRMTDQIGVIINGQETDRNFGLIDSEYKPYPLTSSFADFHSQVNKLRGLQ